MKVAIALAIAAAALGSARMTRELAREQRSSKHAAEPFAPSPEAAPFASLGYRELLADLMFVRATGYFGGEGASAEGIASLAEAIAAVDPYFKRIYRWGAAATMVVAPPTGQQPYARRAVALLEQGLRLFPDDYHMAIEAGEMYLFDLQSNDPAQRRAWDEHGSRLLERAIRMPGAPTGRATYIAEIRSRLGQHQRAVDGLKEILLTTTDKAAQERILEKLARLENDNAQEIAAEIQAQRLRFERAWKRDRPTVPPTWYVLLGPPVADTFDMADLATGGLDLSSSIVEEPIEPLAD